MDKKREIVFQKLAPLSQFGYLAGGTALALQIKHRKSYDFDIFIKKESSQSLKSQIRKSLGECSYKLDTKEQINLITPGKVRVTFLYYPYERIEPTVQVNSIDLASIKDIAADKARTIGRRASWRDYVDIFWLIKEDLVEISELREIARKKFGKEFNSSLFVEQLAYFDDVESGPIEFIDKEYEEAEIKSYLSKLAEKTLQNQLDR